MPPRTRRKDAASAPDAGVTSSYASTSFSAGLSLPCQGRLPPPENSFGGLRYPAFGMMGIPPSRTLSWRSMLRCVRACRFLFDRDCVARGSSLLLAKLQPPPRSPARAITARIEIPRSLALIPYPNAACMPPQFGLCPHWLVGSHAPSHPIMLSLVFHPIKAPVYIRECIIFWVSRDGAFPAKSGCCKNPKIQ